MTKKCAERLGLARLIDTRFTGVAAGVGQATIYGKIHSALLSMNGRSLNLHCSFTVLDHMEEPEMLLGLDMMRRFQACIDLENNVLRIHGTDVPFLPESEIPTHMAQLAASQMTSLVPSQQQSSSVGNKLGTSKSASREMKESDIDALMKIVPSITREKAKNALVRADGNVDLAASILLGL